MSIRKDNLVQNKKNKTMHDDLLIFFTLTQKQIIHRTLYRIVVIIYISTYIALALLLIFQHDKGYSVLREISK